MLSPLIELLIQFGALGLLSWLIYFIFSKAIPSVLNRIENMEAQFIGALRSQDDKFLNELAAQRNQFSHDMREIQQINIQSFRDFRDSTNKVVAENSKVMQELRVQLASDSSRAVG